MSQYQLRWRLGVICGSLLGLFGLMACGGDDSLSTGNVCSLGAGFSKVLSATESEKLKKEVSSVEKQFDFLSYSAQLSPECARLLQNKSGGFYFRAEATAQPSGGYLLAIDMGGDRVKTYQTTSREEARSLSAGAVSVEHEFLDVYSQSGNKDKKWILPWADVPFEIQVVFAFPAPVEALLYPRDVSIQLKALDY